MSRIPSSIPIQSTPAATGSNDLRDVDLDEFLKLLITELQNQDPLNPMENSEILQQISQIREIGATNKLADTLDSVLLGQNMSTASSLIGKKITALTDDSDKIEGVVDRVSVVTAGGDDAGRIIRVHVGDQSIRLTNVREIVGE